MVYRITQVDADDEAETILELHRDCFVTREYLPDFYRGWWWLAYDGFEPVAFAGMESRPAYQPKTDCDVYTGYLCRSGVRNDHRGHGLQLRLIRARERKARELGLQWMVSDTTDNVASANTLINAGYKLFVPVRPWAMKSSLYWKKELQ